MPAKSSQETNQDLTERRRIQNRLSQRNHRRKIRDRIAKLQERVIASELRAAATLHGWNSTPWIPYEVKPSPSTSSSLSSSSSVSSSPTTSSPPAAPEIDYPPSGSPDTSTPTVGICSSCSAAVPLLAPCEYEFSSSGSGAGATLSHGISDSTTQVAATNSVFLSADHRIPVQICEQWGVRGGVYIATETSLPHIIQALGPATNTVILIPSSGSGYAYDAQQEVADMGMGMGMGMDTGVGFNADLPCQCQGVGWMGCPLHSVRYS